MFRLTGFQLGLSSLRLVAAQALGLAAHKERSVETKACFVMSTHTRSNLGSCQGTPHMHVCIKSLEVIYSFGFLRRPWLFFVGVWDVASQLLVLELRLSSSRCLFSGICSYVTLLASFAWTQRIVDEGRDAFSRQQPASKSSFHADAVN